MPNECETDLSTLNDSFLPSSLEDESSQGSSDSAAYESADDGLQRTSKRKVKKIYAAYPVNCPVCQLKLRKCNLYRHLRRTHAWNQNQVYQMIIAERKKKFGKKEYFECSTCHNVYVSSESLKSHRSLNGCEVEAAIRNAMCGIEANVHPVNRRRQAAQLRREREIPTDVHSASAQLNECSKLRHELGLMELQVITGKTACDAGEQLRKLAEVYSSILKLRGQCEVRGLSDSSSEY